MSITTTDWPAWETQFATFIEQSGRATDVAHDPEHVRRVVKNARTIAQAEGGEPAVVIPAAWLHDCVLMPKHSPQRAAASQLAAQAATAFLAEIGYPSHYLPAIAHAIEAHSFSANIPARTLAAQIVQDADRLDAIGAIGVARCLMLGGAMAKPLYNVTEPLPESRPPDESQYVIDHFYQKLLRLEGMMNTESGRQEAQQRTAFMRDFLSQLNREVERYQG
jgi:uncharacterized protein